MRATTSLIIIVFLSFPLAEAPASQPSSIWKAELELASAIVILGEPVYLQLTAENISKTAVEMPQPIQLRGSCGALRFDPANEFDEPRCIEGSPAIAGTPQPIYATRHSYGPGESVSLRSEKYVFHCPGTYRVRYRCQVPDTVTRPELNMKTGKKEVNDGLWSGTFFSNEVVLRVLDPQGVDLEAYKFFHHSPTAASTAGEILRRFPTSTYAGYIVWKRASRTVARTSTATALQHMTGEFRLGNSVPCDDEKRCDDNGWMWLKADELVAWRDRWFASVLKDHPDLWFADDLRFNLALDHYLLGDKAGCEAALEELAASRRPYVAEKVQQLLEAMREKRMLETEP